jgi:ribosome-interacting GTPase 1
MNISLNVTEQLLELESESSATQEHSASRRHIQHLIAGLERQKDELGPIADELITLLKQVGATASALADLPQSGSHS